MQQQKTILIKQDIQILKLFLGEAKKKKASLLRIELYFGIVKN